MKRIFWSLLVCFVLCGCTAEEPVPTQPPTTYLTETEPTIAATEPAGCRIPDSEMEKNTDGAVCVYAPGLDNIRGMVSAGEDLLVFSGDGATTITRLAGENLYQKGQIQLDQEIPWQSVHCVANWVIYYDTQTNGLVYLDESLREIRRVQLDKDLEGYPWLSSDGKLVYYCTTSGVRQMDLERGISRLIKEMTFPIQSVSRILLQDQVLEVAVSNGVDHSEILYLDAKTGSLLGSLPEGITLTAGKEFYYALNPEGLVQQMIFGNLEQIRLLTPENYLDSGIFLPENHAALVFTQDGLAEYYDLTTGNRTASIPMDRQVFASSVCGNGNDLYFLREDGTICRWDLSATPTGDTKDYTGPQYTLGEPNREELAQCQTYAQQLSETHGLNILIYTDAVNVTPFDYRLVTEYQTNVIMDGLTRLEEVLQHFPEGFFESAVEGLEGGSLSVCLVRNLVGSPESGNREHTHSVQFWEGNHAYVAMALGENMEQNFYHDMFHVLETRVLSESIAYYRWDELNPQKFDYDYDYVSYQNREDSPYLEEDSRAFIDAYSMTFPKEDRARVMEYACVPGNEGLFASDTMQKKLRTICAGIREAYHLQDYPTALLWEQYLEKPMHP